MLIRGGELGWIETTTIVFDHQRQEAGNGSIVFKSDERVLRCRMLAGICQRLLQDAPQLGLDGDARPALFEQRRYAQLRLNAPGLREPR